MLPVSFDCSKDGHAQVVITESYRRYSDTRTENIAKIRETIFVPVLVMLNQLCNLMFLNSIGSIQGPLTYPCVVCSRLIFLCVCVCFLLIKENISVHE